MPNKKLEKLKHEQYVAERKLTAAKHREKRLESEIKQLTRSERTHRLCTRAGMMETFLKEPAVGFCDLFFEKSSLNIMMVVNLVYFR